MKSHQFKKKLILNKRTISNLGVGEMDVVIGGKEISGGCPSIDLKCEITYYTCWTDCDTCDHTCTML